MECLRLDSQNFWTLQVGVSQMRHTKLAPPASNTKSICTYLSPSIAYICIHIYIYIYICTCINIYRGNLVSNNYQRRFGIHDGASISCLLRFLHLYSSGLQFLYRIWIIWLRVSFIAFRVRWFSFACTCTCLYFSDVLFSVI